MSKSFKNGALSSFLLVVDSFAKKLVGLASTLVLARVLLPEDFGIIAIASLIMGLLSVLSHTGAEQYLMRVDDLDEEKVNTSWTITLIMQLTFAVFMMFSSFFIAEFYGDPRLTYVLISFSIIFAFQSFKNPGLAFLKRAQNYKSIVKLTIITKVFSATAAVSAALILKSYWALVIGQATSATLMTIGSYYIHNHRPTLKLTNAKEQWRFSGWMIPQAIFGYCRTQLDTFIISSSFGQAALGSYYTMKYIAFIPSSEIITPISQPFLVELAQSKGSKSYFTKQLKASYILLMLVGLPISVMMFFYHSQITALLLGNNWIEHSYLIAAFGLLIPSLITRQQGNRVLLVFAKTKQLFLIECLTFVVVYGVLFINGVNDIKNFAFLLVSMEILVSVLFFIGILLKYTGLKSTITFGFSIIPLLFGTIVGKLFSDLLLFKGMNVFFQLTLTTVSFSVAFLFTIFVLFHLGFKRFAEWEYLEGLISRLLKPIYNKLKRNQ